MDLNHCEMERTADLITDAIMVHLGEARTVGGLFAKPSFLQNDAQKNLVKTQKRMIAIQKAKKLLMSVQSHNEEMGKSIDRALARGRDAKQDKAKLGDWTEDLHGSVGKFGEVSALGLSLVQATTAGGTENNLYTMLKNKTTAILKGAKVSPEDLSCWKTKLAKEEKELKAAIKIAEALKANE